MKRNILDALAAFAVVCFLSLAFWIWMPEQTETKSFSPPSWGVERAESETVSKLQASCETPGIIEEIETEPLEIQTIASEIETNCNEIETNCNEIETEELIEVIPAIENKYLDVPMSEELQDYVRTVSAEYGIPFELTMAVIYVESNFDPGAISDTGDYGLMQVSIINHAQLASDLGITDFLDARQSIRAGCHILADKLRKSGGDFTAALIRYHDGDKGALDLMAQGIFATKYTNDVLTKYYEYIIEG